MTTTIKHFHKYEKVELGGERIVRVPNSSGRLVKKLVKTDRGYPVFKCRVPGCTSYKPIASVLSEKVICWHCGEVLVMDKQHLSMTKPIHDYCRAKKIVREENIHETIE